MLACWTMNMTSFDTLHRADHWIQVLACLWAGRATAVVSPFTQVSSSSSFLVHVFTTLCYQIWRKNNKSWVLVLWSNNETSHLIVLLSIQYTLHDPVYNKPAMCQHRLWPYCRWRLWVHGRSEIQTGNFTSHYYRFHLGVDSATLIRFVSMPRVQPDYIFRKF